MDGAPGARPLAGDRATFEQLARAAPSRSTRPPRTRSSAGEESAASVAGALAQQVWTRAGHRRSSRSGEGAVAIVDDALALARARAAVIALEGGEEAKSLAGLERLWRALAERELERGDVIVCAGGGSVTDVGGFAAATFRRGLPWLAVPSTLVGQVDAAIGGKTAINVAAKNDVGAFWQPRRVLCDPELLETLPPREWAGGMAEVVKTALLAGGRLWELVESWEPGPGESPARTELVQRCAGVKTLVVADDPEDRGRRAILNLGHTIGHGIEAVAGYGGLSHGECVVDRAGRRAAPLGAASRACQAGTAERDGAAARAPRAARARARARPRRGARGHAPRQEAHGRHAPDGAAGGDRAARVRCRASTSRCSPTRYALPPPPTRLNRCA